MQEACKPEWPEVGDLYVWEMLLPYSAEGLIVTAVNWNGEEWWIESEGLTKIGTPNGKKCWNNLGRFHEACEPWRSAVNKVGV